VNLNLPPSARYLDENAIPLAVVPGPKALTNLQSFLAPVVFELEQLSGMYSVWVALPCARPLKNATSISLEHGITVYDAETGSH
jgi:hypothetical protein